MLRDDLYDIRRRVVRMGMNVFAAQIGVPAPAPSPEEAAQPSQTVKSTNSSGARKSFASVLRAAQGGEGKGQLQKSDDPQPRADVESEGRVRQSEDGDGLMSPPKASDGGSTEAVSSKAAKTHPGEPTDTSTKGQEMAAGVFVVSTEVSMAASQTQSPDSQILDMTSPSQASRASDNSGEGSSSRLDGQGMTSLFSAPAMSSADGTAKAEESGGTNQIAIPSGAQGDAQDLWVKQATLSPGSRAAAEQEATPTVRSIDAESQARPKTVDHEPADHSRESRSGSVQPDPQPIPADRMSQVYEELSRLEAVVPPSTAVPEQPVQQKQVEGTELGHAEQQSSADSAKPSDLSWFNQGDQRSSHEGSSWPAHEPAVQPQFDLPGSHSAQSAAMGNIVSPQPRPVESSITSTADRALSVAAVHDAEPSVPPMGRAIVFQVAEPDLGRINVRVALTNEVVHAYLSSDRPDVGYFLMNGHDRLQSALQANGLDMGQFRVDIDRQSAGRSFQQGQPQDQGRTWQHEPAGSERDQQFSEPRDFRGASHAGMLNLVA
jgi:hypothetical protein